MSTTLTGRLGPINRGKTQRHEAANSFALFASLRAWRMRSPLLFRFLVASLIAIATFAIAGTRGSPRTSWARKQRGRWSTRRNGASIAHSVRSANCRRCAHRPAQKV